MKVAGDNSGINSQNTKKYDIDAYYRKLSTIL